MAWKDSTPDYTGARAHDYIDGYTNRPEDAGSLQGLQNILSGAGMVPGVGEGADLLNALLYGIQGKGKDAGLSLLSMLPFIGGFGGLSKIASKTPSRAGSVAGAGRKGDTLVPSKDTKAVGTGAVEDVYQGTGSKNPWSNYLESLFDTFDDIEF
jgi:hypothetical protein